VTPAQLARAAVEGVVCNLLEGQMRSVGSEEGRVVLIGGAARSAAYRRVVADLTGRVVVVPSENKLVAKGAAVRATAMLLGCEFRQVSEAWGLGGGELVEPDDALDRSAIRAAYADAAGADAA
jgi:xylulokinase